MKYATHPAADLFPLMEGADFEALVQDVQEKGLLVPVTIWQAEDGNWLLLDGRNRVRACEAAGVPIRDVPYGGADPVAHAMSLNLKRRQLTQGQKLAVGSAALPLLRAEAAARMSATLQRGVQDQSPLAQIWASGDDQPKVPKKAGKSIARAAELVGVSSTSLEYFERLKRGRPDLAERVQSGEISINAAMEAMKNGTEAELLEVTRKRPKPTSAVSLDRFVAQMTGVIGGVDDWINRESLNSFTDEQIGRWAADLRRARQEITKMIKHLEGNST